MKFNELPSLQDLLKASTSSGGAGKAQCLAAADVCCSLIGCLLEDHFKLPVVRYVEQFVRELEMLGN